MANIAACWFRTDVGAKYGTSHTQSSNVVIRIVAVAPKIPANDVVAVVAASDPSDGKDAIASIIFYRLVLQLIKERRAFLDADAVLQCMLFSLSSQNAFAYIENEINKITDSIESYYIKVRGHADFFI
jgi:hypothetical protein